MRRVFNIALNLAIVALLCVWAWRLLPEKPDRSHWISYEQMRQLPNLILLDVDDREQFTRQHLSSAIAMPVEEIQPRAEDEIPKDANIVAYCRCLSGQGSEHARKLLLGMGYAKVFVLDGSMRDWLSKPNETNNAKEQT